MLVVRDHGVVVESLPALAFVLLRGVSSKVHCSGVVPDEKRLLGIVRLFDEAQGALRHFVVDRLHALPV